MCVCDQSEGRHDVMLFLRNNLTSIEPIWLSGEAEGASVAFLDPEGFEAAGGVVVPSGWKYRKLALPRLATAGAVAEIPSLKHVRVCLCVCVCVRACVCVRVCACVCVASFD